MGLLAAIGQVNKDIIARIAITPGRRKERNLPRCVRTWPALFHRRHRTDEFAPQPAQAPVEDIAVRLRAGFEKSLVGIAPKPPKGGLQTGVFKQALRLVVDPAIQPGFFDYFSEYIGEPEIAALEAIVSFS